MTQIVIGEGYLSWFPVERITERFGYVGLWERVEEDIDERPKVPQVELDITADQIGLVGTLIAEVLDLNDPRGHSTPEKTLGPVKVGERLSLGIGHLMHNPNNMSVGTKPIKFRSQRWMDPLQLWRVHRQKVRLVFEFVESNS